jgi:hypothetical protein
MGRPKTSTDAISVAFVPIAEDTGVGKIAGVRGTAVFSADDVIDLMGETGAMLWNRNPVQIPLHRLARESVHVRRGTRAHIVGVDDSDAG